jgi:hypothetical protein
MRDYRLNHTRRDLFVRLTLRGLGALALLCLAVVLVRAAWGMYVKVTIASQGQEEAEAQLTRLEKQHQGVRTTLDSLATQRGQEAQIRERYALAKLGEGEIDIVTRPTAATTTMEVAKPWWRRMFDVFNVW